MNCCCGHHEEEHGGIKKYPGSTKCRIKGCDCIAFESAEDLMREGNYDAMWNGW